MRSNHIAFALILLAGVTRADTPAPVPVVPVPVPDAVRSPAPADRPPVAPPQSVYDQAFDDAFKAQTEGWLEDPFKFIESDMSNALGQLAEFKTGKPAQEPQEQAIGRLNAVIAMLDQQCKNGAGGGANPTKPLANSIIAKGPGGQGDMHDPKAGEKQWASLPPKQREQILQSKTEGFPPGFEAILQSYYERLAQEQLEEQNATPGAAAPRGAK
jgi:hypothetical protein